MEPSSPPPSPPRRLVLCLDGTWNSPFDQKVREDGRPVLKPTNVLKLCRAILPVDPDSGRSQLVYYDVGVGSLGDYPGFSNALLERTDKALGGAFGAGFEANMEQALHFVALNYRPGDEVLIFGFSRGAATARAVTTFLDWYGGVPDKRDHYFLAKAFRAWVTGKGRTDAAAVRARFATELATDGRPPLAATIPVTVSFLGVWDTVAALGSRLKATGEETSTKKAFYFQDRPARCVDHARHALALDEARFDFRPSIWRDAHPEQSMKQRWFPGVHSNIGGGYPEDGLANVALRWMVDEVVAATDLALDTEFLDRYRGFAFARLHRSESALYRVLDAARLRVGRGRRSLLGHPPTANLEIAKEVAWRLLADPEERRASGKPVHEQMVGHPPYRPRAVLQYLACQPDPRAALAAILDQPAAELTLPADLETEIAKLRKGCPPA